MMGEGDVKRPLLVAGEWLDTNRYAEIRSPWDDGLAGAAALAGKAEFERAAEAAAEAFETTRLMPRHRRSALCRAISEGIEARAGELATLIVRETAKPIRFARIEVARAVGTISIAAHEALASVGEMVPLDISPGGEGLAGVAMRVPLGPVAAITPFNFPINLVAHKLAPAFATGCPVVLKPAPQCPLTALALGEIVVRACASVGAPGAMLSILPMDDLAVAGRLATDPRFAVLSFTGSARAGWALKERAPRKRVVLELGGNAAAVVHKDALLDRAVEKTVAGSYASSGQVCIKVQRIIVHREIIDEFVTRFHAAMKALPAGDPMDPDTVVSALIDDASADRVEAWVTEAVNSGARVVARGGRTGRVVRPVLLADTRPGMKVWDDEIFGPVSVIEPYADIDEAFAKANDSRYGLQAGVFTRDLDVMMRACRELRVGGVMINDAPTLRFDNCPYGGTKDSGFGREGIRSAMREMTEERMVILRP